MRRWCSNLQRRCSGAVSTPSLTSQLARRATAQAHYDLAQADAAQHDAMYTLLAAMDLPPTTKLRVADASERPLPKRTAA